MKRKTNKETVLVIAAHPDDEVLGCGGSIASHVANGDDVHVVIMAEGITSRTRQRDRGRQSKELSQLAETAHRANKILGVDQLTLMDLPDNRMDSLDRLDVVKLVEDHISRVQPTIVYTHWVGDVNVDHQVIHQAVITGCRPMPGKRFINTLAYFEVSSSTEWQTGHSASPFIPNWFRDISQTLDQKLRALEAYASEMRPFPHARSIEAVEHLAKWRGATVGATAAEAFVLGRKLV